MEVAEVASQVLDTMGHLAKQSVQILMDLKPVPPIIGDASRISQILMNLVGNALKFTERGQVTICVAPSEDNAHVRMTVRDTGIGIAPDKHAKIFQAFEQVTETFGSHSCVDQSHTTRCLCCLSYSLWILPLSVPIQIL